MLAERVFICDVLRVDEPEREMPEMKEDEGEDNQRH